MAEMTAEDKRAYHLTAECEQLFMQGDPDGAHYAIQKALDKAQTDAHATGVASVTTKLITTKTEWGEQWYQEHAREIHTGTRIQAAEIGFEAGWSAGQHLRLAIATTVRDACAELASKRAQQECVAFGMSESAKVATKMEQAIRNADPRELIEEEKPKPPRGRDPENDDEDK